MHRVRLSHVVGVLCDVLVSSVASGDLILVAVPQAVADLNSRRPIEAIFKRVADDAEVRQAHPAGLHRAGSGHSVAFALLAHFSLDVLLMEKRKKKLIVSSPQRNSFRLHLKVFAMTVGFLFEEHPLEFTRLKLQEQ
jgi:hypothetical protein